MFGMQLRYNFSFIENVNITFPNTLSENVVCVQRII